MRRNLQDVKCLATSTTARSRLWQIWLFVLILFTALDFPVVSGQSTGLISSLRKETEDLFYHGYENYMKHAFPEDELRPISCKPLTRDRENPAHIELNDPLGNYSLTLLDSLSTLAILASTNSKSKPNKPLHLFQDGIKEFVRYYGDGTKGPHGEGLRARGFDLDSKVQVFETVIRGLGGLLSAHLFAVGDLPIRGYNPPVAQIEYAKAWHKEQVAHTTKGIKWANGFEYNGQLLRLAYDLGKRLLPAFWTSTGIPYPRVSLRHGIPFYTNSPLNFDGENGLCGLEPPGTAEITETCSAGAGSLVLEFTVLSRLTGDSRFEDLAKRAFWAIWNRRSDLSLIGAGIDAESGEWINSWTGVGAGIDSFFEYAFKSHILLSRETRPNNKSDKYEKDPRILLDTPNTEDISSEGFLKTWNEAHTAIKRHIYRSSNYQHPHYIQADLETGAARWFWVDALSAYYPGLLTLAGHVEEATEIHLLQTALWTRFSALPERWNLITGGIESGLGWWVGRPEFIESTYYLYRATEDPWYLYVGEMVLRDIKRRCWTACGWAGLQNVLTGEKIDRMESFFLGETAKYLYLLFDHDHPLNHLDAPFVFTTEGHPLIIPNDLNVKHKHKKTETTKVQHDATCPRKPPTIPFTISATASRGDLYHAASLARLHLMPERDNVESFLGEYAADHPSITVSDITSPSNYTYYPWTLPPSFIPFNAMSLPMKTRPTFDITFPNLPNQGQPAAPLQRIREGIVINFLGGLRVGMIQDMPVISNDISMEGYRIQSINNLALGKDEKVFLSRDAGSGMLNPTDPNFNRIRDAIMLDVVLDLQGDHHHHTTTSETNQTSEEEDEIIIEMPQIAELQAADEGKMKAMWNAIVSQITNLIQETKIQSQISFTALPGLDDFPINVNNDNKNNKNNNPQGHSRFFIPGITSTGIGSAPIPDWPEPQTFILNKFEKNDKNNNNILSSLQFNKIFSTNKLLCDEKLSEDIVKNYEILLIKRGGCTFSKKLNNIPNILPSSKSLKLVIIISGSFSEEKVEVKKEEEKEEEQKEMEEEEEEGKEKEEKEELEEEENGLIRPFLDFKQFTPTGLPRHNPIPLIMVDGGSKTFSALSKAKGIGIKRRYTVQTQGIPIGNLILL